MGIDRRVATARIASALLALLALLTLAYCAACLYIATSLTAQRHLPNGTPADVGLAYEPIAFSSVQDDIPLKGWYLPSSGTRAIILLHGIDGNRWDTDGPWLPKLIPVLVHDGFDLVLFDFRAHGESGGDHVGLGVLERRDVQAAVSVVEQRGIPPGRIGLYGQSYGASVALVSAAAIPDVAGVVSDSAFADARDRLNAEITLRTGLPPLFGPGVSLLTSALYGIDLGQSPEHAMPLIAPRPVLLIHGTQDERTPVDNAYRLKAATNSPNVELWIVPGATHTESYMVDPQLYTSKIVNFFESVLGH